jgi:hypothetical protein
MPTKKRLYVNIKKSVSAPNFVNHRTEVKGPIIEANPPIKIIVPLAEVISLVLR